MTIMIKNFLEYMCELQYPKDLRMITIDVSILLEGWAVALDILSTTSHYMH